MKTNVGNIDRALRIAAGIAILAWGYFAQSWFGLFGIVPLMTGALRWCPAYCPFGISTKGSSSGGCCAK